ncbi:MAG: hypothetical protein EBT13_12990, partial [Rhodobacteraceae bacterium]|nr:hypothetical protein [Paracoccaceae bacterium]
MNVARIALAGMIVIALVAGVSMYYLQVYAYYDRISAEQAQVELTSTLTGQPEPILFDGFNAIDSDSSPIRYRACFHTELSMGTLTDTYQIYETAEPLVLDRIVCLSCSSKGFACLLQPGCNLIAFLRPVLGL